MLDTVLIGWLVVVNAAAFVLAAADKRAAREGRKRTPEIILLLLAIIGGAAGLFAAMHLFRHKTRKSSFQLLLALIILLHYGFYRLIFH